MRDCILGYIYNRYRGLWCNNKSIKCVIKIHVYNNNNTNDYRQKNYLMMLSLKTNSDQHIPAGTLRCICNGECFSARNVFFSNFSSKIGILQNSKDFPMGFSYRFPFLRNILRNSNNGWRGHVLVKCSLPSQNIVRKTNSLYYSFVAYVISKLNCIKKATSYIIIVS
jgi:hypothetical protein